MVRIHIGKPGMALLLALIMTCFDLK